MSSTKDKIQLNLQLLMRALHKLQGMFLTREETGLHLNQS